MFLTEDYITKLFKYTMLLVETDIQTKILASEELNPDQKDQFIHLLSYFTPSEIEELKGLL